MKRSIKITIANDPSFTTHLLLRVDGMFREVVKDLVLKQHAMEVRWSILVELTKIEEELQFNRFLCPILPSWISTFQNSNSTTTSPPGTEKGK